MGFAVLERRGDKVAFHGSYAHFEDALEIAAAIAAEYGADKSVALDCLDHFGDFECEEEGVALSIENLDERVLPAQAGALRN